jgi:hypothetical protein
MTASIKERANFISSSAEGPDKDIHFKTAEGPDEDTHFNSAEGPDEDISFQVQQRDLMKTLISINRGT